MQWLCDYALHLKRHDFGSKLLFRQICYGNVEKRDHSPGSARLDRGGITYFLVLSIFLLLGVHAEWELSLPLFMLFLHEVRSQNLLGIYFYCGSDSRETACNTWDPDLVSGWEDPLEKGMATHSSLLAWRTPWTEEPGGPQSLGSQGWTWLSNQHAHKSKGTTFCEEGVSWDKEGWSWGRLISSTRFIYMSQLYTFFIATPITPYFQNLIPQFFLRKGVH